ncbi:MAG: hypothetical protein KBA66_17865 [Leptospiraceae bacterium]|nr:hypothetical protein [Leptospiraceae bacterium]
MKQNNYYLIYGILLCTFLYITGHRDLSVGNFFSSGKWGPKGHSSYHK